MDKLKPIHIAWPLPIAYLLHLFDEYFTGAGLAGWYSSVFKASLSVSDFIVINTIGFTAVVVVAILYTWKKVNEFTLAILGSLFFVNGLIHLAASVLTFTYSPGTISGIIIYVPLGVIIFKKIFPFLQEQQRSLSVPAGIAIQILVTLVAFNI